MASLLTREWTGFQQFPAATRNKLLELLGKLKQENVNTLTILVLGKGGVGKSSTVNSLIGERAVTVNNFQAEALRPVMVSRSWTGLTLNIIDTPGLVEGGYVNHQTLELIKRFLLDKTIDVVLYVDRLDTYRVDELDKQLIKAITENFGREIWGKSLLVLTHAQICAPDELSYDVFQSRRSETLIKTISTGSGFWKWPLQDFDIPVVLVENSGRCNKNEHDEKIIPNGDAWIPNLIKAVVGVVTNGSKAIVINEKSNDGGKLLIPLVVGLQCIVVRCIRRAIQNDMKNGGERF